MIAKRTSLYFDFLRFAVASRLDSFDINQLIKNLNNVIEYKALLWRLIPLLRTKAVENKLFEQLSPSVQVFLSAAHKSQAALQLAYNSQLESVLRLCVSEQIPIVLLKGAALNGTVYPPHTFRAANDIDIWIDAGHWVRAEAIFRQHMKYQSKPDTHVFGDLYELTFVPKNGPAFEVDLHKHLTHPQLFSVNYHDLFAARQPHLHYDERFVSILSPECSIIHQAIHAYNDMDFLKYNLCDTYMLITKNSIDWHLLVKTSKHFSVSHIVFILLTNVTNIFGLNIPEFVLQQLSPNLIQRKAGAYLLNSKHGNIANGKTLNYRLHQVASQYVFTHSVIKPLKFQMLYLYKRLTKIL